MRKGKKEEGKMKRLSITALLLIALTTGAVAHEGSIGMFTDMTGNDCDLTFSPFLSYDVFILYMKSDAGPNGIFAAQFKVELPPAGLTIQEFVKSPEVAITTGNIGVGISCSFSNCSGAGVEYVLIGTITVVAFVDQAMDMKIVVAEDINPENPPVAVRVSICDEARTMHAVLGGWFKTPNGTCNVGTEETSWGAIKDMYRD